MARLTSWFCNWRGFAGCNDECGERYRIAASVSRAVREARLAEPPWGFVLDERLDAKDLDDTRPRELLLCPAHYAMWLRFFGARYEIAERKVVAIIAAQHDRQFRLFPDDEALSSPGSNMHEKDTKG